MSRLSPTKLCIGCGKLFSKNYNYSVAYWNTQRFCSQTCGNQSRIGTKQSEETKAKKSMSLLKTYSDPSVRKNLIEIRKRQYQNGFNPVLGKHWKLSEKGIANKMGAKNPAWLGGITPINKKIRNSQEYAAWRKQVFERDDYRCMDCGKRGEKLHADHIYPFAQYPRLRLILENGQTLCIPCHRKTPTFAGRGHTRSLTIV